MSRASPRNKKCRRSSFKQRMNHSERRLKPAKIHTWFSLSLMMSLNTFERDQQILFLMTGEKPTVFVLLSHDVDWGRAGPSVSHILARRDRFDRNVLRKLNKTNPYPNIPEILELEDRLGVRSTFFFRTHVRDSKHPPPSYNLSEYRSDIRSMLSEGWEVGLHSDFVSSRSLERLKEERSELEAVTGVQVLGNRVHYTLKDSVLFQNLKKLGFKYDSSVKHQRERITRRDFGYLRKEGLIVFPITIMDSLIFAYNVRAESDILRIVRHTVDMCEKTLKKSRIMTLVWHDCSLKMRFGRKYAEVINHLVSRKNASIERGIDLALMIERGDIA